MKTAIVNETTQEKETKKGKKRWQKMKEENEEETNIDRRQWKKQIQKELRN